MKQYLERHIKEIFNSLGIKSSFDIYDINTDLFPEWASDIEITNELLVCSSDIALFERLQSFTGKKIFENGKYLYWFEGDSIRNNSDKIEHEISNEIESKIDRVNYLKTKTRLPNFLDDFIFNKLQAIYAPDYRRFDYNLDLKGEEILRYLGTYFPRSYAEAFCIFDNIFQNESYKQIISSNPSFNVLAIGSGTGGDIIGLLTNIDKHFEKVENLNIWLIDGNLEALNIVERIIDMYEFHTIKEIRLKTIHKIFKSILDFHNDEIGEISFDFILSFKFINELIHSGKGIYDNSYYQFAYKFLPLLSLDGLCVLLDVTTKPSHNNYYPILMNNQINQALRELTKFEILIPRPCSAYNNKCHHDCFQQKTFMVAHSKHSNDKSKVTYKILANRELKEKIENSCIYSKQLITEKKICPFTVNGTGYEDAYLFK